MRSLPLIAVFALATPVSAQQPGRWWWFYKDSLQQYAYAGGDEFNGRSIDREQWMTSFDGRRNHHGTHSQEYITDGKNIRFMDGIMHIATRREQLRARGIDYEPDSARLGDGGPNLREWKYTAGGLVSKGSYQFGVFEARVQLPRGQGAWPSFWLFGGQPNEEFDIFEGKGERPDQFHVDVHCPGGGCNDYRNPIGGLGRWLGINWPGFGLWRRTDGDLTAGFNDYVGEWTPQALRWYLNDQQAGEWKGTLSVPARLLIMTGLSNTCKGCPFGPGPNDTTTFTDMRVDHVRVWRLMAKDDPALTIISAQGLPRDLTAEVRTSIAEAPQASRPKGGKRGKVRDVFRVKTLHDSGKRVLIVQVTGDVPDEAYIDLQDPEGATLLKRRALQPGIYTFTFASGAGNIIDVLVGDGERSAVERVMLN